METPNADITEETLRQMVAVPIQGPKEWTDQVYGEAFTKGFEYIQYTGEFRGDILEFGTFRGYTAHIMAHLMRGGNFRGHLWLYDSFEGLPALSSSNDSECYLNKKGDWISGGMSVPQGFERYISESLSKIIPNSAFTIVKGYFEDSMEKSLTNEKAALVHLDCDLYSSSKYVLEKLLENDVLQDGTLLYCDDYNCNRSNLRMGQRGALSAVFTDSCRFTYSEFFSYGWFGKAFFIHDKEA